MKNKMIGLLALAAVSSTCWLGYVAGQKHERTEQEKSPKWSAWSPPETIRPSPPFPQWVIIQYKTNTANGEVKAHVIANGSPRSMFEPDVATTTK